MQQHILTRGQKFRIHLLVYIYSIMAVSNRGFKSSHTTHPMSSASAFSQLFWLWLWPLLFYGRKNYINVSHCLEPLPCFTLVSTIIHTSKFIQMLETSSRLNAKIIVIITRVLVIFIYINSLGNSLIFILFLIMYLFKFEN